MTIKTTVAWNTTDYSRNTTEYYRNRQYQALNFIDNEPLTSNELDEFFDLFTKESVQIKANPDVTCETISKALQEVSKRFNGKELPILRLRIEGHTNKQCETILQNLTGLNFKNSSFALQTPVTSVDSILKFLYENKNIFPKSISLDIEKVDNKNIGKLAEICKNIMHYQHKPKIYILNKHSPEIKEQLKSIVEESLISLRIYDEWVDEEDFTEKRFRPVLNRDDKDFLIGLRDPALTLDRLITPENFNNPEKRKKYVDYLYKHFPLEKYNLYERFIKHITRENPSELTALVLKRLNEDYSTQFAEILFQVTGDDKFITPFTNIVEYTAKGFKPPVFTKKQQEIYTLIHGNLALDNEKSGPLDVKNVKEFSALSKEYANALEQDLNNPQEHKQNQKLLKDLLNKLLPYQNKVLKEFFNHSDDLKQDQSNSEKKQLLLTQAKILHEIIKDSLPAVENYRALCQTITKDKNAEEEFNDKECYDSNSMQKHEQKDLHNSKSLTSKIELVHNIETYTLNFIDNKPLTSDELDKFYCFNYEERLQIKANQDVTPDAISNAVQQLEERLKTELVGGKLENRKLPVKKLTIKMPTAEHGKAFLQHLEGLKFDSPSGSFMLDFAIEYCNDFSFISNFLNTNEFPKNPMYIYIDNINSKNIASFFKTCSDIKHHTPRIYIENAPSPEIKDQLKSLAQKYLLDVRINNGWQWYSGGIASDSFSRTLKQNDYDFLRWVKDSALTLEHLINAKIFDNLEKRENYINYLKKNWVKHNLNERFVNSSQKYKEAFTNLLAIDQEFVESLENQERQIEKQHLPQEDADQIHSSSQINSIGVVQDFAQ